MGDRTRAIANATRRPKSAIPRKATSRNPTPIQMNASQMAGRTTDEPSSRAAIIVAGIMTPSPTMATVSARAHAGPVSPPR